MSQDRLKLSQNEQKQSQTKLKASMQANIMVGSDLSEDIKRLMEGPYVKLPEAHDKSMEKSVGGGRCLAKLVEWTSCVQRL